MNQMRGVYLKYVIEHADFLIESLVDQSNDHPKMYHKKGLPPQYLFAGTHSARPPWRLFRDS